MSIDFERRGPVALITINRPEAMNALDVEHNQALESAWKQFEEEDELLVAILSGAGGKAFSSGGDLKSYLPWRREQAFQGREGAISFGGMTLAREITKPVIAAIQGYCVGGGLEIAMACDIRICTPDARFALPEVRWGVLPGGGGTQRLPRLIATGLALELILTGDTIDADRAERIGLVNRVIASDELIETAHSIAERIAQNGPTAVKAAKRSVMKGLDGPLSAGLEVESGLQKQLLQSDDAEEGLRAFAERRRPIYGNRTSETVA